MLIFDFDGTILDLWPKYHHVFCQLTQIENLSIEEYKKVKQKFHKDQLVADYLGYTLPQKYFQEKPILLENKQTLMLDKPFFNSDEIAKWFGDTNAMVLTKRRNHENLIWQIEYLGFHIPVVSIRNISKAEWIHQNIPDQFCCMVGDSLEDLETGRLSNVDVCMVEYGLGTKDEFDTLNIEYRLLKTPDDMAEFVRKYINAVS